MAFFLTQLFLITSYLHPTDVIPELAALRIAFWIGNAGMLAGALRFLMQARTSVLRSPQLQLMLAFFTVLVLSPIFVKHWTGGAVEAFSLFSTTLLSYCLMVLAVDTLPRLRATGIVLIVLALVIVGQCALAVHFDIARDVYILGQNLTEETAVRTLDRVRGLGFLNDPNDLAQALVAIAPLLWPFWRSGRLGRNFFLVGLPSLFILYGVFLTHSRGGFVSIAIVGTLLTRQRMTRYRTAAAIGIAVVMVAAMSISGLSGGREISGDESSSARLDAWAAGFQMLKSNPLFGVGFGAFIDFNRLTAHNSFVLCLAELGLSGYFLWFGLLAVAIWELSRVQEFLADEEEFEELSSWCTAAQYSLFAFLSGAFFLSRTYSPSLYVSLAIAFVVVDLARQAGYESVSPGAIAVRIGGLASASVGFLYCVTRFGRLLTH